MALNLIDKVSVNINNVIIKFGRTVTVSSLVEENFEVYKDGPTPVKLSSPFRPINTITDYNQISRALTLYWDIVLESETDYIIKVINLKDSSGQTVATEEIQFTTGLTAATPSILTTPSIEFETILIEDNSIRTDIETSYQIIAKNPFFYIESTYPKSGSFYIAEDENNGRIIIKFNENPAANYINNNSFRTQRKKIQRFPTRWENIESIVSLNTAKKEVYVDLPSIDATPSYNTPDLVYFESGYKYRIIVSALVGT